MGWVLVFIFAISSDGGKFPYSFSFLCDVFFLTVSSWSFGCIEIGVWSLKLVGMGWGIVNVLLTMICVFSLSGSGLSDTVGFNSDVGFGSALMALCMSCNGEDGVALGPKPCV